MKKFRTVITLIAVVAFLTGVLAVATAMEPVKININTATVEELTQLKKVGKKYAQHIVDYREKNGAFKTPEDIKKVKGIGAKIFEINKEIIAVE